MFPKANRQHLGAMSAADKQCGRGDDEYRDMSTGHLEIPRALISTNPSPSQLLLHSPVSLPPADSCLHFSLSPGVHECEVTSSVSIPLILLDSISLLDSTRFYWVGLGHWFRCQRKTGRQAGVKPSSSVTRLRKAKRTKAEPLVFPPTAHIIKGVEQFSKNHANNDCILNSTKLACTTEPLPYNITFRTER